MQPQTLLLCKKNLQDYSDHDLAVLARNRNLNVKSRDDLCWLLCLDIMSRVQRGQMGDDKDVSIRNIFKRETTGSTSGFADKYNLHDYECRWPTRMGGFFPKDCNFNYQPFMSVNVRLLNENMTINIVKVPSGTKLYRGTKDPKQVYNSISDWPHQPIIWFASTFDHTMPLGPVKIHEFTVKEPLFLIFTRNLTKSFGKSSGFNFIPTLFKLSELVLQKTKVMVDGYLGCNECEFGLYKQSLDKIDYPSTTKEPSYIE